MTYNNAQIAEIKSCLFNRLDNELNIAVRNNEVESFLRKYNIVYEDKQMPVNVRTMKILVFGALAGNKKDYQMVVKKLGIDPNHVVFYDDYSKLASYNVAKLEYSNEYSDIIYGPAPHKIKNMGETSSFLATIKASPEKYPKLCEVTANSKNKITISNFKRAIENSRFYEAHIAEN